MSSAPDDDVNRPDADADRQADAMKDQLRKDVASWSAGRSEGSVRQAVESRVPVAKPPSLQPAKRVRKAKPVPPEINPTSTKKPFSMSYDGVTAEDYITYMIARGAR
jgi:hypothetical protein